MIGSLAKTLDAKHKVLVLSAGLLVTTGLGLLLNTQLLAISAALGTVLAIGLLWPWCITRGLQVSIRFDADQATEGQESRCTLTIRNRSPFAAHGLQVYLALEKISSKPKPTLSVARVPAFGTYEITHSFVPECRGVYPSIPPVVTSGFPFGIFFARRSVAVKSPCVVYPATFPAGPVPERTSTNRVAALVASNRTGNSGDVLGVRDYRHGDTCRHIHWAQTAKRDLMMVRELQSNDVPVVQIVLDLDSEAHTGSGPEASREWAIRIAASCAVTWLRQGALIELICSETEIPYGAGRSQEEKILHALAMLPWESRAPLAELVTHPRIASSHGGHRMIVTSDQALLANHSHEPSRFDATSYIVLETEPKTKPLPVRPWARVRNPDNLDAVAQQFRESTSRGVAHAS